MQSFSLLPSNIHSPLWIPFLIVCRFLNNEVLLFPLAKNIYILIVLDEGLHALII